MIYFIGGAPRAGKSISCQQIAAKLGIGWISTDLLWQILQTKNVEGTNIEWNASPQAITAVAEWFYPCLERFAWGISSAAENYLIEGVAFLPAQMVRLATIYPLRAVFLGCSQMTLERFDEYPGRSPGYSFLPEAVRRRYACDIPQWSKFIQQEAESFGYPFVDMIGDFQTRLDEVETLLVGN